MRLYYMRWCLLVGSLLLFTCTPLQQDGPLPPMPLTPVVSQRVTVATSAAGTAVLQSLQQYYGLAAKPGTGMRLPAGTVLTQHALHVVNQHHGHSFWSFKMAEPDSTAAFRLRNVVLQQVPGGYMAYIVSFTSPNPVKFNQAASPFAGFQGTITWHNLAGQLLSRQVVGQALPVAKATTVQRNVNANQCLKVLEASWQAFDGSPCTPLPTADDDGCHLVMQVVQQPCTELSEGGSISGGGSSPSPGTYGPGTVGMPGGQPGGNAGGSPVPPETGGPTAPGGPQVGGGGTFVPNPGTNPVGVVPTDSLPGIDKLTLGILPEPLNPYMPYAQVPNTELSRALQLRLDYLKTMGRRDFAEFVEELLVQPGITVGDAYGILEVVHREYLRLRAEYMIAVFEPVALTFAPFIELYTIEILSIAAATGVINLMQSHLGGRIVKLGQLLKISQSKYFQTFVEVIKIAGDINDVEVLIGNRSIKGTWNNIKKPTTLNIKNVTEAEVRALFKKMTHNGVPRIMEFPDGMIIEMVDFEDGNTMTLRNKTKLGGDMVIGFNTNPYRAQVNSKLPKFKKIKFFLR